MIVLIKNLPISTKEAELRSFVSSSLKTGSILPFWGGKIKKIGMFPITTTNNIHPVYYGVVFLNSRKAGTRVIKNLNGKRFKHQVIEAREFIMRSKKNDRRLIQKGVPQMLSESRKGERRRDAYSDVSRENKLVLKSSIFERENVYLPRRRGDD